MPKGTKRPDTKEKRLASKANDAKKDFIQNRSKLDKARKSLNLVGAVEAGVRSFKDKGKMDKMNATKKASKDGPKGIKSKSVYSKKGMASKEEIPNWREYGTMKNGVMRTK